MKKLLATLITTIAIISVVGSAGATIIYDNTTNLGDLGWNFAELQTADFITLGGTDRSVTEIKIQTYLNGSVAGTADTQVRFYSDSATLPGALLWASGLVDDHLYNTGSNLLTFSVPNIVVPDTFWWSIQVIDLSVATFTRDLLLRLNGPPTVGSSGDFFADKFSGSWATFSFSGDPIANFGAQPL